MEKSGPVKFAENCFPVPERFQFEQSKNNPMMLVLTDKETGKQVEVGQFAYSTVRKVLGKLF